MNVAVVGAGVIGCAIAHELAARGARVTVFERRGVARGASWASAGVLAPWIEAHERGPLLEMCARSLAMYDGFVDRVRADGGSAFEYARPGTLETAFTDEQAEALQRTAKALRGAGVRAAWLDREGAIALEPALGERILGGLRIDDHGFAEMPALVDALAVAARMRGAAFHAPIDVTKIEPAPGGLVRLHAGGTPRVFDRAVIAGGSWANRLKTGAPPVRPVKGQLVRLRFEAPPATRVLWSDGCYIVPWQDGTALVGATMEDAGFDERPTSAGVSQLLEAAAALLPAARDAAFVDVRAGLRPSLGGSAPFVGPSPAMPGVTIAAGHFRNGVLLAPLTAALAADQVLGDTNAETQ
jgi:glycine oxidase